MHASRLAVPWSLVPYVTLSAMTLLACEPADPVSSLCQGDGCKIAAVCANFVVEAGEGCDDGNTTPGDGCSATCTVEPGYDCCGSPSVCGRKGGAPLVAGGAHTCAVRAVTPADPDYARSAGEALVCWGDNSAGQLGRAHREPVGDDETPGSEPPIRLGGSVQQLAAGAEHTCALLTSGAVRCFGNGKNGRLGYGRPHSIGDNEHPDDAGDVPLGARAIAIAAGDRHTCAVLVSGAVRCWGAGETGALGYKALDDIGDDETPESAGDVPMEGLASAIAAGADHTCALLTDGRIRCWGRADRGQLGHGRGSPPLTLPASEKGVVELGESASAIGAGDGFSCAILSKGGVRCWGAGPRGQLGLTSRVPMLGRDDLVTRASPIELDAPAVALSVGAAHACVRYGDGRFNCWGVGDDGRLGRASTRDVGWSEVPAKAGAVAPGGIVTELAAGGAHTCLRLGAGYHVRCFGRGDAGQLGLGRAESVGAATAVAELDDVNLTVGVCGDGVLDRVEACDDGDRDDGDGCAEDCEVENDWTCEGAPSICAPRPDPVKVVTGEYHACVLSDTGTVRCFGLNDQGQLGLGHREPVRSAERGLTDVSLGGRVVDLAAGISHTCALLEGGAVRCWGSNFSMQLGLPHRDTIGDDELPSEVPVVPLPEPARQVAAARFRSCALHGASSVTCWGDRSVGSDVVGVSLATTDIEAPVAEIAVASEHVCVRLEDGRVGCMGVNAWAVCGRNPCVDGGTCRDMPGDSGETFSTPPVWFEFDAPAIGIAVVEGGACALLASGDVHCWGTNEFGLRALGHPTFSFPEGSLPPKAFVGARVVAIRGGARRFCVITETRNLRCWGQLPLGYPREAHRDRYPDVVGASNNELLCGASVCPETPAELGDIDVGGQVVDVGVTPSPWEGLTCALTAAGDVRCWGDTYSRILNLPSFSVVGDDEPPSAVPTVPADAAVIGLAYHGQPGLCMASEGKRLRCFGGWEDTWNAAVRDYDDIYAAPREQTLPAGRHIRDVVTGAAHLCTLRDDGVVSCGGYASDGRLGVPGATTTRYLSTMPVDLGFAAQAIVAGAAHTCALSVDGRVRCWGDGTWARLGYRSNEIGVFHDVGDDETPASAGDVDVGGSVKALAAGGEHTCALLTDGRVRCWGSNFSGQLGYVNGSGAGGRVLVIGDDESPASAGDVDLGGRAVAIAAGERFTCAVLEGGAVRCWGDAGLGQGGRGVTDRVGDDERPSAVDVVPVGAVAATSGPAGAPPRTIAAGPNHVCVVTRDGGVRCWGEGRAGLLGQATGRVHSYGANQNIGDDEPASDGLDVDVGGRAVAVRAGRDYTCAILETGAARCWGPFAGHTSRGEPVVGYDIPPSWVEPVKVF